MHLMILTINYKNKDFIIRGTATYTQREGIPPPPKSGNSVELLVNEWHYVIRSLLRFGNDNKARDQTGQPRICCRMQARKTKIKPT